MALATSSPFRASDRRRHTSSSLPGSSTTSLFRPFAEPSSSVTPSLSPSSAPPVVPSSASPDPSVQLPRPRVSAKHPLSPDTLFSAILLFSPDSRSSALLLLFFRATLIATIHDVPRSELSSAPSSRPFYFSHLTADPRPHTSHIQTIFQPYLYSYLHHLHPPLSPFPRLGYNPDQRPQLTGPPQPNLHLYPSPVFLLYYPSLSPPRLHFDIPKGR